MCPLCSDMLHCYYPYNWYLQYFNTSCCQWYTIRDGGCCFQYCFCSCVISYCGSYLDITSYRYKSLCYQYRIIFYAETIINCQHLHLYWCQLGDFLYVLLAETVPMISASLDLCLTTTRYTSLALLRTKAYITTMCETSRLLLDRPLLTLFITDMSYYLLVQVGVRVTGTLITVP